jgi:galactokinase
VAGAIVAMIEGFRKLFGSVEGLRVFRAPGRVNVIGEHTDYNLGFVMPMALQLATYVGTAPSSDGKVRIYSEQHGDSFEWEASRTAELRRKKHWSDYPAGVAHELAKAGFPIEAANLYVRSSVPEGAGLSSSAALEVSSALAFLNGRHFAPLELAKLCQRAEVEFVGLPCGIMDQYVSVFGQEHSAVEIDCRSLEHRYVELPEAVSFIAVNSMVKHALGTSAYRTRVEECAAAVEKIRQRHPSVQSLRDVSVEQLEAVEKLMPPIIARRARHVVTENERVNAFASADLRRKGQLMFDSHRSLQYDYEVSCPELDFLVDEALGIEGVYGSRMTGGGFGGCTVTMVERSAAGRFREKIAASYRERFGIEPMVIECRPSQGAGEVADFSGIPDGKAREV